MSDGDLVAGELAIGGMARRFTTRPPRRPAVGAGVGAGADRAVPLVLVLHGNGLGGQVMREWTTFDRQADARGWAVAYPDGHEACWADGRCVTAADGAGVDDVAFLRAIIDWSAARYGTVPDRSVVAGMSNGAFMAHRLALQAGDRVAVLAAVAGGMPAALAESRPAHAVSAMLIHGTADRVSPIGGGYSRRRGPHGEPRGRTLSLGETAERWRAVDGCPPGPGATRTTDYSSRTASDSGAGGTRVVAWTVFGAGHTWPGTPVPPEWDERSTLEFDAAEEICGFAAPLLVPADARRR